MIKILHRKARYDFMPIYNNLPRYRQPEFRHSLMASQKWTTRTPFYNAMRGDTYIDDQLYKDIVALFTQFGTKINHRK